MIIINNTNVVKRWNKIMNRIGLEHENISDTSELCCMPDHYLGHGCKRITKSWMISEAEYWLSCYYEKGNSRHDEKYEDEWCRNNWYSETSCIKRLIDFLNKVDSELVAEIVSED